MDVVFLFEKRIHRRLLSGIPRTTGSHSNRRALRLRTMFYSAYVAVALLFKRLLQKRLPKVTVERAYKHIFHYVGRLVHIVICNHSRRQCAFVRGLLRIVYSVGLPSFHCDVHSTFHHNNSYDEKN